MPRLLLCAVVHYAEASGHVACRVDGVHGTEQVVGLRPAHLCLGPRVPQQEAVLPRVVGTQGAVMAAERTLPQCRHVVVHDDATLTRSQCALAFLTKGLHR